MGLTHSMTVLSALLAGPGRFEHWPVERSRSNKALYSANNFKTFLHHSVLLFLHSGVQTLLDS